jgi:hypothetical protein
MDSAETLRAISHYAQGATRENGRGEQGKEAEYDQVVSLWAQQHHLPPCVSAQGSIHYLLQSALAVECFLGMKPDGHQVGHGNRLSCEHDCAQVIGNAHAAKQSFQGPVSQIRPAVSGKLVAIFSGQLNMTQRHVRALDITPCCRSSSLRSRPSHPINSTPFRMAPTTADVCIASLAPLATLCSTSARASNHVIMT